MACCAGRTGSPCLRYLPWWASWAGPSPVIPEAAAACSPAGSRARAIPPRRAWVPARVRAPAGAQCAARRARPAILFRGPAPRPALPRFGNPRRYCSIAPDPENRGRGARRCCTACRRGAPHNFPGRRRRYRHRRTATDNTIPRCRSSARRAMLPLQSREQGYETHGAERLAIDPRLTLGVTIQLLAAVRAHRRD
jgi:hypothetical protein